MFYGNCPACGKPISVHAVYSKTKSPCIVLTCNSCGYKSDRDKAGWTYRNVLDRYGFTDYLLNVKGEQYVY